MKVRGLCIVRLWQKQEWLRRSFSPKQPTLGHLVHGNWMTTRYDVQALQRWSQNRMDKHYLIDVSISNVLAISDAPNAHSYCLPKVRVTPPKELSRLIWPEMDAMVDAYSALPVEARDKDTTIAFFLEAMLRGGDILLQDCAVLMEELPTCAL